MQDTRLWRLLEGDSPDADEVLPLLAELAALTVQERFPFFGRLPKLLLHRNSQVRAAAVHALRGASGTAAFRHIVAALHDATPEVRLAAVAALRESASSDSPRWAHAVFHADPAVRRAALEGPAVQHAGWFSLYLLADEACAREVIERLPPGDLPAAVLPMVFDFHRHGVLLRSVARRLVLRVRIDQCYERFQRGRIRTAAEVEHVNSSAKLPNAADLLAVHAAAHPSPAASGRGEDLLDELLDLFWDTDPDAEFDPEGRATPSQEFFRRLMKLLVSKECAERGRAAASLVVTALRRGEWNVWAADLCAVVQPEFFVFPSAPAATRRQAARALYELGNRCPRLADEQVKALIEGGPFRRTSGSLDLWFIGGLLHLVQSNPYQRLQQWFSIGSIASAFLEDMVQSAPFLCLTDNSQQGRSFLIDQIVQRRRPQRHFLTALLVYVLPSNDLEVLDDLSADDALCVFGEMLQLASQPELRLPDKRAARVAEVLGSKLVAGGDMRNATEGVPYRNARNATESSSRDPAHPAWQRFLELWLDRAAPEESPLGLGILTVVAKEIAEQPLLAAARSLDLLRLRRLLHCVTWCAGFPYGKEVQLARGLTDHADPTVRAWAEERAPGGREPRPVMPTEAAVGAELSLLQSWRIALSPEANLRGALVCCLVLPVKGLSAALGRRPPPAEPSLAACVALLGSLDSPDDVAAQFVRFGAEERSFLHRLDTETVRQWQRYPRLGILGHAWLHNWEQHCFRFAELLPGGPAGLDVALRWASGLPSPTLSQQVWFAAASLLGIWRWRDRKAFQEAFTPPLGRLLADSLSTNVGEIAAGILVKVQRAGLAVELLCELRARVVPQLADLSDAVRAALSPWIDSQGLGSLRTSYRPVKGTVSPELLARIRKSLDVDQLEGWCREPEAAAADEAALRLLELGEIGVARMAAVLAGPAPPAAALTLAATISLWPAGNSLDRMHDFAQAADADPELQFAVAAGFLGRGEREAAEWAIRAACRPAAVSWFRPHDWRRLLKLGVPQTDLMVWLALSPQPHAYTLAIENLLAFDFAGDHAPGSTSDFAASTLETFLNLGTLRLKDLRVRAARRLHELGNYTGFPLLLGRELESSPVDAALLEGAPGELAQAAVAAFLVAGPRLAQETVLLGLLEPGGVAADVRDKAYGCLLADAAAESVRNTIVERMRWRPSRTAKLRRVAKNFAWGVRLGRELTGRLFTVEMLAGDDLGYTRLHENKIYVNPLPLLRAEQNGEDVVRALLLHELGHHVYHRGEAEGEVWEKAQKQRLHSLLNLVADEHLERNLRATDRDFGDRLKRLSAYAFQHAQKEIPVEVLLDNLQGKTFAVLSASRLGVARRRGCVSINNGQVLRELEAAGMSFARFVRALRMGLGNRHHDPLVAQALELFPGGFRRSTMEQLYDCTLRLREIFGWQVELLDTFCQNRSLCPDPSDLLVHGEGITNDEVQSEIRRILDPRTVKTEGGNADSRGGGRWINVNPSEDFRPITTIVPVPYDAAKHAEYAAKVVRDVRRMRQYFERLGIALVPQRFRLRGKSFDRTRAKAVVLRGDPRMLVAREPQVQTDLFLAVIVDCSGSMQVNQNIEKAKLFGSMLAEAAKGVRGIDLRIFGFTDSVIYDAGHASRCAAHSLASGGGNNDAAALWHAAQVARQSRRRAKLLVMISDGLPTECSVAALRALVQRLTSRWHLCCAQVAVQPLAEVCFPNYILLDEANPETSVRRFGEVIAGLVQKALRT